MPVLLNMYNSVHPNVSYHDHCLCENCSIFDMAILFIIVEYLVSAEFSEMPFTYGIYTHNQEAFPLYLDDCYPWN
jgi:hypothetical protein